MTPATSPFENAKGVDAAIYRALRHLEPPPDVMPSRWAETSVHIPDGNAVPGPMRMANAPYQREPMDMSVNPDCRRISLMWGAQVGKTMVALVIQGFHIEVRPSSQMMMQPSQGDLTTWLETKFNPLVEANEKLRSLIAKPRGREGVNNQRMKSYPGGFMMYAWSGSPKTMRGRSAPKIVCDEVDGYERTEEGHPVGILWQRAATFRDQRLLVEISTPTIKDESYIEKSYEAGDQRQFYIGCPHCEHAQTLKWENVHWIGRKETDDENMAAMDDHLPETAAYACEECGTLIGDGERIAAIRVAEEIGHGWKAAKPFRGHASYHLNELYSTFRNLSDIVQSYLDKLATDDLQTFINVALAKTWELKGEKVDPDTLMGRRKQYRAQIPAGALFITCGIDMQMDRLELEIVAWGLGDESWSIDYRVLWGDPLQDDVWADLDDVLAETFLHESGAHLPISAACLDTGGTNGMTQAAYEYAKGKTGRRLFAIKGIPGWGRPIVEKPMRKQSGKNTRKVDLFNVGVDEAKLIVMRRLAKAAPGPGHCHFPLPMLEDGTVDDDGVAHGKEYFKQLTAEKMVTRYVKGQPIREWHKPDRARNEALDCRVYALAALKIVQPSFKRLALRLAVAETGAVEVKHRDVPVPDTPANDNNKPVIVRPRPRAEIPQEESKAVAAENVATKGRRVFGNGRKRR